MMKTSFMAVFIFLFMLTSFLMPLEAKDPSQLTLERIFSSKDFKTERFGPARWLEHRSGYTTLEPAKSGVDGMDIVLYSPKSGKRTVLVKAELLKISGTKKSMEIENYSWSPKGNKLLIFTNTQRVWRQNTRGDYWLLNLVSKELWKLGGKAKPSTLMFAKFSPDGLRVAYVCGNNIFVQEINGSKEITQITFDGSKTIINGTFDWVYEEEFGLRDGFRWSPDGKFIAYWQLDAEGVGNFYLINNTEDLYSKIIPVQYPKVGTTNSAVKIGVISAQGGDTQWFKLPGDSRQYYLPRMDWADCSDEIVFQKMNRLQNTNEVIIGNIKSDKTRTILKEKDKAWLEVVDDLEWLNNGNKFTWISERDGWRHVYLVSRSGDKVKLVTPGDYDVISIEAIDKQKGTIYFIASPKNNGQRYLFTTRINGKGQMQQVTPPQLPGIHRYQISPDAKWAIHSYSTFNTPPVIDLVFLPSHRGYHRSVRNLENNSVIKTRIKALNIRPGEFFKVEIDEGILLDGWSIKPSDFDPQKKYPVLFHVYGEPAGQTVLDRWGGNRYLWHQMIAQMGYVIISVDNRGTPAPRGRAWRKCVYRQIGILASADQAAAVRAIVKKFDFVDSRRIAIWGWSGGGSMSLNAIFRYPDLYHTAMSVAPVANQRLYDTIYQERYMGLPQDNVKGYKNGSPITFAHQLKGNLLLVHGTGDDNVHYQNSEVLINALIKENKAFTMMAYPNRSHSIREGENTQRHLFELLTRYLTTKMPVAKGE
jgi:dipeptidyl-peptidase-4